MKAILSLFIFFSASLWAANDCDYTLTAPSAIIQLQNTPTVIQRNVSLYRSQQSPTGQCYFYRLFFSKGSANNYQRKAYNSSGQSITYNLHQAANQSGVLKDYQDAYSSSEYLAGTSPSKLTPYNEPFFISVPGLNNLSVPGGVYTDTVNLSIYALPAFSIFYRFDTSINFTVLFQITSNIQISLIDEGGTFDPTSTSKVLDFGNLQQNALKAADLRVVSNGPYQIRISSQNNGKLKQTSAETVNYSMKVNNTNVNLASSSGSPVLIGNGNPTASIGDRYNLSFQITENVSAKAAGMYQDVLTITAIAN